MLSLKLKDKTDISVGLSDYGKLIKNYEVLKIPKVINSLAFSFLKEENKITYEMLESQIKQVSVSDTNKLTLSVLENLEKTKPEEFQFLIFVSQFSEGVSFDDLNMFSIYDEKHDYSFQLPVKKNWLDHYKYLISDDSEPKKKSKLETAKSMNSPIRLTQD